MSAPRILLTGFEPFGGEAINPSIEVARRLHGWQVDGAEVHALELPCVFGRAIEVLSEALDRLEPALVIALGQAGSRSEVTVERIAINVDDARIPDNAGAQPIDVPIAANAPAAYFATLPMKAIVAELRAAGLPASVSQTAGTFVCNHVFYGLMHWLAQAPQRPCRGGFIHLPLLPAQAARQPSGAPSMALETMVEAVRIAVRTAWRERGDRKLAGGALD